MLPRMPLLAALRRVALQVVALLLPTLQQVAVR
jgi:hypothetical protein